MTELSWDAGQYLKFGDQRTQPARDLIARVPLAAPRRIVDLGCGPGNSTALLAQRWPDAEVSGVDNSPEMLAQARRDHERGRWIEADIATFAPAGAYDLIFSNAALQWVPEHARVFPRLLAALPPGGVLAVQMPRNFAAPTHALLRDLAADPRWSTKMPEAVRVVPVAEPGDYYDILSPISTRLDIFEIEYQHVMDGPESIVEWMRGTGLRPFLQRLSEAEQGPFLTTYLAQLAEAYPRRADGKVLLAFRRIFVIATRG